MSHSLAFDASRGETRTLTLDGITVEYRAFEGIVYVAEPIDLKYQTMNLYVPEAYYRGEAVGGYTADAAPIFFPNTVGGYMPGEGDKPGSDFLGRINPAFYALAHGYVVASPGLRGRTLESGGKFTGKAPACIVDYKAAVRYLRFNRGKFPGDTDKIVSNGTSAGGALSALLGATGNHPDYAPYLEALGAADASDHIFASSCYCPIINLENADLAYEWLFADVYDFAANRISFDDEGKPVFTPVTGTLTDEQKKLAALAKEGFAPYLASLQLKTPDGETVDPAVLRGLLAQVVAESAQRAVDGGEDLSALGFVTLDGNRVTGLDFEAFLQYARRMKTPLAFDGVSMETGENDLFGSETVKCRHFSPLAGSLDPDGAMAEPEVVRMMNPMCYVGQADAARHWRIRHGAADRDTALAVPTMFTLLLRNHGCEVDFQSPWGVPHMGDYGVDELFAWIDGLCR